MNFLELINKCLLELNYKRVSSFSELVKNDHTKIKNIINLINKEICFIENWDFLLRKASINLPKGASEVKNTINGRILYLFIDNKKYEYSENIERFLTGKDVLGLYSCLGDKLLLPVFDTDKTIEIVYYTHCNIVDEHGNEKCNFVSDKDESLIPMPFAEQLLVYGTCLRMKANPQYIKFSYWMSMYKEALANLKSKCCISAKSTPVVHLHRN